MTYLTPPLHALKHIIPNHAAMYKKALYAIFKHISCPHQSYNDVIGLNVRCTCIMEERFFAAFIHCYFIAFGVFIGGAIIGSIGSFATGEAPLTAMTRIAKSLRFWAIVAAIGGTFDAIANFEKGIVQGSTVDLFKQILLIISAMSGVRTAQIIMMWLTQEDVT